MRLADERLAVTVVVNAGEWSQLNLAQSMARFVGDEHLVVRWLADGDVRLASLRAQRLLFETDLFHWLSPSPWKRHAVGRLRPRSVVSLHHVDDSEPWWCEMPPPAVLATHSTDAAAHILQTCRRRADVVLPYGFDPTMFSACGDNEKARARTFFGIAPDSPVVGSFGNAASWRKGVPLLLDALGALPDAQEVSLVIAGPGWDSYLPSLERLVGRVVHAPATGLHDMRLRYAALDVYACTSLLEGGPLPVLEALACSVPVVSTPVGHVPDMIRQDRSNGCLVPTDADSVASGLTEVLRRRPPGEPDPSITDSVREWSWPSVAATYRTFYSAVCEEVGKASLAQRASRTLSVDATLGRRHYSRQRARVRRRLTR